MFGMPAAVSAPAAPSPFRKLRREEDLLSISLSIVDLSFPVCVSVGTCNYRIPECANFLNLNHHFVSVPQPALRCAAEPHAGRRSGTDDIAGLQSHEARDMLDKLRNTEDQFPSVRMLERFAPNRKTNIKRLRIGDLVAGDNVRAQWCKGTEALAQGPLGGRELYVARAHIVQDSVAEYVTAPIRP